MESSYNESFFLVEIKTSQFIGKIALSSDIERENNKLMNVCEIFLSDI